MKIYENHRGEHSKSQKTSKYLNYRIKKYQLFSNSSVSQLSMAAYCDAELFHGTGMRGKGGV